MPRLIARHALDSAERLLRAIGARFQIRAFTLTTYDTERDQDEKTLRAAIRAIEIVAVSTGAE